MDGHDDNPAPKKRVRTVSTLNQEQVRKKRENDREAQRAFRERTKNRIQILEAELSELRSEREKQGGNVSQEVKGLREENAALKQQLRQISAIIGQERSSLDTGTDKETSCIVVRPQDKDDSSSFQAQTDDVQHDATNPDTPRSQADHSDNYMPIYDNALVPSISQPGTADDTTAIEGSLYDQTSDQTLEQRPPNYRQNINVLHESHHTDHIETGFDQNIKNHFSAPMYPQSPPQSTSCGSEEIRLIQDHQPARQSEHSRSLSLPSYNLGVRVHSGFESTQEVSTETSTGGTHNESNNTKGFPSRESGMYLSSAKPDSINVDIVDFASDGYLDGGMMGPSSIHGSSVSPNATTSSPAAISPSWVTPETVEPISMSNILPRHLAATCPLDQILLDFLASRRVLASHGTPVSTLIGPPNPSISGLINPKLKNSAHATSRVMVDVVSTFKDTNLREQLGFLYIMYTTLRVSSKR